MNKDIFTLTVGDEKKKIQEESRKLYTINEVAKMLGVHQQTLRNWERKKLVMPLRVGSRRIYTDKHINMCKRIREYSGRGVSLKGIRELFNRI